MLLTLTLPLHAIRLLYQELLSRTLDHADTKPKRDETAPLIGDDGELSEWVEQEMKTKQAR